MHQTFPLEEILFSINAKKNPSGGKDNRLYGLSGITRILVQKLRGVMSK